MDKPKFDPSKPFNTASAKPKFDPSAPFDSGGSSASAAPVDDSVVEEMHPNFSTADRLIVKNFAGNNQAAVNYLQKQHPDLEIKTKEFSDKILARKRDGSEKDYKVLDPDTGFFSTDFLRDVGDIGFDIASGVGTGAATAAGGIAGVGFGSIPAAAAAGAASSAGLEAGRQGLGKMLGIEQDIDMGDVGFAGAAGALSPLLLGTGATTAQAAAKSLNPFKGSLSTLRGMAAPELDDAGKALLSSQRGLIGRGYDAYKGGLAPKLGSAASGIHEDVLKFVRDNPQAINAVDPNNVEGYATNVISKASKGLHSEIDKVGSGLNKLRNLADEAGQADELFKVDMTPVKARFLDDLEILKRQTAEMGENTALLDEIDALESVYANYLGDVPDSLSASNAFELKERLKKVAIPQKLSQGPFGNTYKPSSTTAEKRVINAGRAASKTLQDEINRVTGLVDGSGTESLNSEYAQLMKWKKQMKPFLNDENVAFDKLSNIRNKTNKIDLERFQKIDKKLGLDTVRSADNITAHKIFSKAPWLARSSEGTTSTSRTIGAGAVGAGLGYYLGAQSGLGQGGAGVGLAVGGGVGALLGGPAALNRYMQMQRGMTKAATTLKDSGLRPNQVVVPSWLMMQQRKIEE